MRDRRLAAAATGHARLLPDQPFLSRPGGDPDPGGQFLLCNSLDGRILQWEPDAPRASVAWQGLALSTGDGWECSGRVDVFSKARTRVSGGCGPGDFDQHPWRPALGPDGRGIGSLRG